MTLDGLEQVVRGETESFRRKHNINFVRYADDFVITANNRAVLEQIGTKVESFLAERGVSLSKEKTKITHIRERNRGQSRFCARLRAPQASLEI